MIQIWRFQCDPAPGDADPDVQVFLRHTTTDNGMEFTKDDTTPVTLKLSELAASLADPTVAVAKAEVMKAQADAMVTQIQQERK